MTDSNSYSSSTVSGTGTGVTNTTSTGSSSSSASVATIVQTSSPDESQGMSAQLGGEALAMGENTLTGNLSGTLIDVGSVTSAELSASMLAATQSPTGPVLAVAGTSATVYGSPEVLVGATIQSTSSNATPTGSVATATSTTNLVAYDIHPTAGGSTVVGADAAGENDPFAGADIAHASVDIDGNIALIEFNALVVGDDTLASVDAFALAVEDELSISGGFIELAVG